MRHILFKRKTWIGCFIFSTEASCHFEKYALVDGIKFCPVVEFSKSFLSFFKMWIYSFQAATCRAVFKATWWIWRSLLHALLHDDISSQTLDKHLLLRIQPISVGWARLLLLCSSEYQQESKLGWREPLWSIYCVVHGLGDLFSEAMSHFLNQIYTLSPE